MQDQLIFIDEMDIKILSLSDNSNTVACTLKNLFTTEDFRILSVEQRPLSKKEFLAIIHNLFPKATDLIEKHFILLNYVMENIKYSMIFSRSISDFQKPLDLFKNYPCKVY